MIVISGFNVKKSIKENRLFQWFQADNLQGDPVVLQILHPDASWSQDEIQPLTKYFESLSDIGRLGILGPTQVLCDPQNPLIVVYPDKQHEPFVEALARDAGNIARWWGHAAGALHHLHESGLAHGRVSLDSFVVVKGKGSDRAYLTNFGYAPLLELGHAGALAECREMAAPEILQRKPKITPAADIYAFAKALAKWNPRLERCDWFGKATATDPKDRWRRMPELSAQIQKDLRPKVYTLTVRADPTDAGSVSGGREYQEGEKAQIEAKPRKGWRFEHWSGDHKGSDNPASFVMDGDKLVVAHFLQAPVILQVKVEPPMAGLAFVEGDQVEGNMEFARGQKVTVEVQQTSDKWEFTGWKQDATGSDKSFEITMDADKVVVACFEKTKRKPGEKPPSPQSLIPISVPELTVKAEPQRGGQISGAGKYQPRANNKPSDAIIEAKPRKGYRFVRWEGDVPADARNKNPLTLTMDGNKALVAHFAKQEVSAVRVSADIEPPRAGRVEGAGEYRKGDTVTLEARPASPLIIFWRWVGDVTGSKNPIHIRANHNIHVTAQFRNGDEDAVVRNKVFIMTLGSPVTICPFIAFMTSLMVIWAFGISITSGLAPFVCIGGLIVNCGIFLTRLILGSERLTTRAREEIAEEKAA